MRFSGLVDALSLPDFPSAIVCADVYYPNLVLRTNTGVWLIQVPLLSEGCAAPRQEVINALRATSGESSAS